MATQSRRYPPAASAPLAVALALLAVELVAGHGYLTIPPARNTIAYQHAATTKFYNPSSGNGNGFTSGPGNPSACGDPFQAVSPLTDFLHKTPSPWKAQATYKRGQVISTTLTITTNHGGIFRVSLCNSRDPAKLTLACFQKTPLINTATSTPRFWIQSTQTQFTTTISWRLPTGFSCASGCVLMWEYTAMQSCILPCACSECGNQYCKRINPLNPGSVLPACFDPSRPTAKLEYFRNCADIAIV